MVRTRALSLFIVQVLETGAGWHAGFSVAPGLVRSPKQFDCIKKMTIRQRLGQLLVDIGDNPWELIVCILTFMAFIALAAILLTGRKKRTRSTRSR
jgi:hypothetical protein